MECQNCHRPFQREDRIASISGTIMGDEKTDTYYFCPVCRLYSVELFYDDFTGIESATVSGPLPKEKGDRSVELIRQCDRPWDKNCRCPSHLAYFNNNLD